MSEIGEIRFVGDIERLSLKPSDALIVTSKLELTRENRAAIRAKVEQEFPGHKCLVLSDGLDLSVVEQ